MSRASYKDMSSRQKVPRGDLHTRLERKQQEHRPQPSLG